MLLTKVEYEGCFNLGNYENEKIRVQAKLSEGENLEEVVKQLRSQVAALAGPKVQDLWSQRSKLTYEVDKLTRKLEQAKQEYQSVVAFMTAQGLKTDMPAFPVLKALTGDTKTDSEVIESNPFEDDDDEDDEDDDY